jgi:hypothetical protein
MPYGARLATRRIPTARWAAASIAFVLLLGACSSDSPLPFLPTPEPTPEQPREVVVETTRYPDDTPLPGVTVSADGMTAVTGADGHATLVLLTGARVEASLAGHDPAQGSVAREGPVRLELRPNVAHGIVRGESGAPVAGARVFVEGADQAVMTDAQGAYALPDVPAAATLIVKRAGFRLAEAQTTTSLAIDVTLEPFQAHALYAPAAVFEAAGRLDDLIALAERTEINAFVIDVKETDGRLYFATDLPAAVEVGAVRETPVFDASDVIETLHEHGIYAIARVVVMKDNTLAVARPELAVRNTATGEPWRDNIGGAWLDPSAPGVAEYIAAVAGAVADAGFDEVQLDYVRWYSDGPYDLAATNLPNTQSVRLPSIQRVLRMVHDELDTRRAFLSADCFPIAFIVPDDEGIGQRPEVIMPFVDYFSPMVYPSHYGPGVFGFDIPNNFPYPVIDETLQRMNVEAAGLPLVIRPWIQDFGYGPFAPYTASQVQEEMRAAADNGTGGWMIWNARARFTEAALAAPREGEEYRVTTIEAAAPAQPTPTESGSAAPSASP